MENAMTEEYKTYKINIVNDDTPESPRGEWENFGKMTCFHNRYKLGDKHDFNNSQEVEKFLKKENAIYFPLYLYDHSGITMSTTPFSCPWDSGQIGYIYVLPEDIKKEFSCKKITKKIKDKVIRILESEVEIYDQYLTGEVYGYQIIDKDNNEIDSCYGFYDNPKELMKECKHLIDTCYDYQLELI